MTKIQSKSVPPFKATLWGFVLVKVYKASDGFEYAEYENPNDPNEWFKVKGDFVSESL